MGSMIEIFNQKFVKDILILLFKNREGMFFTSIQNSLADHHGGVHQSAVSRAISTLVQYKMIEKEEIRENQKNIPKSYYKITEIGDFAIEILEKDKIIEKMIHSKSNLQ